MLLILRTLKGLLRPWTWRTAWRDGRSHLGRMLLYTSSIIIGVAALVAIRSFGENTAVAIGDQSRSLLGADLVVRSRHELSEDVLNYLNTVPGERSEQTATAGMAVIPKSGRVRLIQRRSSQPGYPWYGEVVTEPPGMYESIRGDTRGAIVEESMMEDLDMAVGDDILVDGIPHVIVAALKEMPGESNVVSELAPRVLTPPLPKLPFQLPFTPERSMKMRQISFKLAEGADVAAIDKALTELRRKHSFSFDTPETLTRKMGRRLQNLFSFLGMVGFVALLLGGIGVAGSVSLYVRSKLPSVAMLRCIGAKSHETVSIYVLQALWMGLAGGLAGGLVGTVMQIALAWVFKDLLPFTVGLRVSWASIGMGVLIGVAATFLFALLPLLNVRRVPPLMALRADLEPAAEKDPIRWLVYAVIGAAIVGFAVANTPRPIHGILFSLGLFVAAGALYGLALALSAVLARAPLGALPFPVRQGFKNLYRPRNQTTSLTLCLGLGIFLILSQYLADVQLVRSVTTADAGSRPNLVLFEVQNEQMTGVAEIFSENGVPTVNRIPVVKMKLHSVKGVDVQTLMEQRSGGRSGHRGRWIYSRVYRVTARRTLGDGETLVAGTFTGTLSEGGPIPVSLEEQQARRLGVWVGDDLSLTCGDAIIPAVVTSIREVEWLRLQPTFFVVFPEGALDGFDTVNAVTGRAPSEEAISAIKRDVVSRFPNVWAIDMGNVVDAFTGIFDKIAFTVRFMALFSMVTGIMVLLAAVRSTRAHRVQENALLRTLGADGRSIFVIMLVEYGMLGLLGALAGSAMAVGASWAVTALIFKLPYQVEWLTVILTLIGATTATAILGLLNSRSVTTVPPLQALRTVE